MLGKLLKYDLRELKRQTLPMFISSLIVSIVCCGLLFFTLNFNETDNLFDAFGLVISFFGIGIFAIIVIAIVAEFVSLSRYFKSLFTDEGYLNMVIPVKTSTLLNSKILAVVIWNVVTSFVTVISLFFAIGVPTLLFDSSYITDILDLLGELFSLNASSLIVFLLELVVEMFSTTVVVLAAITIGAVLIRSHKILGAIIFYFVISFIKSLVESGITLILDATLATSVGYDSPLYIILSAVFSILLASAIAVVMYIVNLKIMDKKFNIE